MKPLLHRKGVSPPLMFLIGFGLIWFMSPILTADAASVTHPLTGSLRYGVVEAAVSPANASLLAAQKGTTYYVSTSGSNSNPGTLDSPWRTIQYAVDHTVIGDTVYVRAGTYSESVRINTSGNKKTRITLSSYNGEPVTIDGGSNPALRSDGRSQDSWNIGGFTLTSSGRYTLEMGNWGCFNSSSCKGSQYWYVHNNVINGAVFISGSYLLFESNKVDGSRHTGDENGVLEAGANSHHNIYRNNEVHDFTERGFWSESLTHDGLWEGNYVHDIWGNDLTQGIDMDGYKSVEWKHRIINNRIERVSGLAIQLENTFASRVENNVIVSPRRQGIVVINYVQCKKARYGADNCLGMNTNTVLRQNLIYGGTDWGGIISYGAGGIKILGNTIANTNGPSIYLSGNGTTPKIVMKNNILSAGSFGVLADTLSSLIVDKANLIDSRGAAYKVINGGQYSVAQYQAAMRNKRGQKSIQADPGFVDAAANDFRLAAGSPAINAGIGVGVKKDLSGVRRPQQRRYDIGAFEFRP